MANTVMDKIIKDFSTFYNIEMNNFTYNYDKVPITKTSGNKGAEGLRNIVSLISKNGTPEYNVIQDQWVEFALILMGNLDNFVMNRDLRVLNDYISDKVYFVGNELGPVDVLLYFILYNIVSNLTFQEKEKYLHFSRWFNNVQHKEKTRSWRSIVPFSKSLLYAS